MVDYTILDVLVLSRGEQLAHVTTSAGDYVVTPIPVCGDDVRDCNILKRVGSQKESIEYCNGVLGLQPKE